MFALLPLALAAPDPEAVLKRWGEQGVVLGTEAQAEAWGPAYDPLALGGREGFLVEVVARPPPWCPPFPDFCCSVAIGVTPWLPYNGGCAGPVEGLSVEVEGGALVLRGEGPLRLPGGEALASGWSLALTPRSDARFEARWRPDEGAPWSAPLTLVALPEGRRDRLDRWRAERGAALVVAAGVAVVDGAVAVGQERVPLSRCEAWAPECRAGEVIAVCPGEATALVVEAGVARTTPPAGVGAACAGGAVIPGVELNLPRP